MQGVLPGPLHRQGHALHQRSGDQWGSPGVGPGGPPGPRIATGRVQGSIDGSTGLGAVRTIQVGHVSSVHKRERQGGGEGRPGTGRTQQPPDRSKPEVRRFHNVRQGEWEGTVRNPATPIQGMDRCT